jgi:hypothetical protein
MNKSGRFRARTLNSNEFADFLSKNAFSQVAECLGTAFLLAAVVGSGIMGEKLASGNIAIGFSVPIFAQQKGVVDLKHSTDSRGAFAKA